MGLYHNVKEPRCQDWQHDKKDGGKLPADSHSHNQRKTEHDGASDSNADYHLVRILHIGDVRGQTRHQTGRRKAVNIGKRKLLYVVEHILSQIPCHTGRGPGRICPCQDTEYQSHHGHN